MSNCHYHPLAAATYRCQVCHKFSCDHCSDETDFNQAQCLHCHIPLQSLGSAHSAPPFWRRIDASFKYALNRETLIFLGIIAILSAVVMFLPMSFLWQMMLTGALMKYSFCCLQNSAMGDFSPPDISESYEDGLSTLLKLFAVTVGIFAMSGAAVYFFGASLGSLLAVLLIAALPAAIIILALNESILEALNPFKLSQLIRAIGLPYGLLLGLMLIMSSSVALLSSFFGTHFSVLSLSLQSFVSNFYMLVMFHIMGYMIFQYQSQLGFVAKEDEHNFTPRSELEKCKTLLAMRLIDGEFEPLIDDYVAAIKRYPQESLFIEQCFELIHLSANKQHISEFGCFYLETLMKQNKDYQLSNIYKRICQINPDFMPDTATIRLALAQIFYQAGNYALSAKLLAGLHKSFPDFAQLPEAYKLLADSLKEIPQQAQHAQRFYVASEQLRQKRLQANSQEAKQPTQPVAADTGTSNATQKPNPPSPHGLSLIPKDEEEN